MRELILLRHAHAESSAGDDADRALSATGQAEAKAVGAWMREHALIPDRVLVSPAVRTRQTWEAVRAALGDAAPEASIAPAIYEATPGTLMELLEVQGDVTRVLLVGHNPGMEQLVALLSSGQSGDYRGMPPAGVAVLGFEADAAIEPGAGTLIRFWWP